MTYDAEVIVIGAGPAGCAAAIRLALAGHDVLGLERLPSTDRADMTSGEVLAPQTQEECARLGIELDADWLCDRLHGVRNVYPDLSWTYHAFPDGLSYVQVDRGGFNAALRKRAVAAGARFLWGARVSAVEFRADAAMVRTAEGGEYTAPLVIDAGGRYAPSLRLLGLKSEDSEFCQIGIAVFFGAFAEAPLHAWDRHLYGEHGTMISGSRIRAGLYRYILETDLADKQAAQMRPVAFYESVAKEYDPWLYERIMAEPRTGTVWAMAPVGYRVTEVARDRLLLAGDAAGYLAPLTGQGIEFAMRMGRIAAETSKRALAEKNFSAAAFTTYIDGRREEVETALAYLRYQLRVLRDRDALLRAAHDDAYRIEVFGPIGARVADRGRLRYG